MSDKYDEENEDGVDDVVEPLANADVIDIDSWRSADIAEAHLEQNEAMLAAAEMRKVVEEMEKNAEMLSFWEFFSEMFVPENNLSLPLKAFHKQVCDVLEKAVTGGTRKKFIIVNIPPRVGKTKIMEALACWQLAYFQDSQIIYTSFSGELASASVRYIMETLQSGWYRKYFGEVLGKMQRADQFTTLSRGRVYSAGTCGTITGFGGGLKRMCGGYICIDDPAKPNEAQSKIESALLRDWFAGTLLSRRNSSIYTPIIICAQRLAVDDLPGYLLATYDAKDIEHIKIPALQNGRSVIPETISTRELLEMQQKQPFTFASQYQQEPMIPGGNLFKIDGFNYYDADPSTMKWENKVIVCDTAFKTAQWNDFTVIQCWGKSGGRAYLIDQVRGKWETPQLPALIRTFWEKHNKEESGWIRKLVVEEHASGTNLIQSLRKDGIPVYGIKRIKDKVSRAKDVTQWVASGLVYLPKNARWLSAFLEEIGSFREDGKSAHDDQCLVAGTLVRTELGDIPIENVKVGMRVHTRKGYRRVLAAGETGIQSVLYEVKSANGNSIKCTGSHPVLMDDGMFVTVDKLIDGDTVMTWPIKPHQQQKQSYSTGLTSIATQTVQESNYATTSIHTQDISATESALCIERFGRLILEKFQRATSFITKTGIRLTTRLAILSASRNSSISTNTSSVETLSINQKSNSSIYRKSGSLQRSGTHLKMAVNGIQRIAKGAGVFGKRLFTGTVNAAESLSRHTRSLVHAAQLAAQKCQGSQIETSSNLRAQNAGMYLSEQKIIYQLEPSRITVQRVVTQPVRVYNLKVEEANEYIANGIVVHNCDAMVDGLTETMAKKLSIFDVLGTGQKSGWTKFMGR